MELLILISSIISLVVFVKFWVCMNDVSRIRKILEKKYGKVNDENTARASGQPYSTTVGEKIANDIKNITK